jgi:choline dehydrogenase
MPSSSEWDYIVVGAGSAGCVIAARLSENPDRKVLLIEAGGGDLKPSIQIPGLLFKAIASPKTNWRFQGEPDPTLGGRSLNWAAGKVLGGGSSINGMVFSRGIPANYDDWAAEGNPGWDWAGLLPYFKRSESWQGPPNQARGAMGPLQVRPLPEIVPACAAWLDAAEACGIPRVEDYNAGIAEGLGFTQASQRGGWRHSTARAYLRPVRGRRNLQIMTRSVVDRLVIENGRCVGVAIRDGNTTRTLRAARETVVSTGAIATPKLLMLSGIGPADHLRGHGIAVVHALEGVGDHLNEHVNVKISVRSKTPTYTSEKRGFGTFKNGLRWLINRTGPAASVVGQVHGFIKSDSALPHADLQIQVMPFGFDEAFSDPGDAIGIVISLAAPKVRGKVTLRSADRDAPPEIHIPLLSVEDDVERLLRGCEIVREINRNPAASAHLGDEIVPGPAVRSKAEWLAFFRSHAALNWHPTSTCRMGNGETDVVDSSLRVHGLAGLSIADCSVMPSVPAGNTNAPVIALGEKAAELIAGRT